MTLDVFDKLTFGNHKGKTVLQVIGEDFSYIAALKYHFTCVEFTEDLDIIINTLFKSGRYIPYYYEYFSLDMPPSLLPKEPLTFSEIIMSIKHQYKIEQKDLRISKNRDRVEILSGVSEELNTFLLNNGFKKDIGNIYIKE